MKKYSSIATIVTMLLLFSSVLFAPTGLMVSSQTLLASQQVERSARELRISDDLSSPMRVSLLISSAPLLNQVVNLSCVVTSDVDALNTAIQITLPNNLALKDGSLSWKGDILEEETIELDAMIQAIGTGDGVVVASARTMISTDSWVGGRDFIYVSVSEHSASISKSISKERSHVMCVEVDSDEIPQTDPEKPPEVTPQPIIPSSSSNKTINSPGYITIKGYFYYYDRSNTLRPAKWVTVWAYDDDMGIHTYLGADLTDENGYYEIGPINNDDGPLQDGLDVFVRFIASNTAARVNDISDDYYDGFSTKKDNVPDGDVWFPNYRPPDSEKQAWWIFYTLLEGWNYLANIAIPHYSMEQSTARWASGHDANYGCGNSGTHYHPGGQIHLDGRPTGGHANDADVILHEYGHNVMYAVYGHWMPPNDFPGSHTWWRHEGVNHAWMEGWACFLSLAVFNDRYFSDTTQNFQIDFETRTDSLSYIWHTGDDVDGNVGAALWDIFDSHNDGYDSFSDGFNNIWDVIYNQEDNNFAEFYAAWRSRGKDRHLINFCAYQNTIGYNVSPALTDGQVDPTSGYTDTTFTFWVYYKDTDHDPASTVKVYIYDDGWFNVPMDHYSGDPASGEWFRKPLSGFSPGDHNFYFTASDGIPGGDDRDPSSGYYSFHVDPKTYNIHLESRQDTRATSNLGTITFDGVSYTLPNDVPKVAGRYQATYYPASRYVIDHWETDGDVSVPDPYSGPITWVDVNGDGTLRAVYRYVPPRVCFYTNPVADPPSITFDGATYYHGDCDSFTTGSYQATANPPPGDYRFHHWTYGDGVYVSRIEDNPTTVDVSYDGWLKAIFAAKIIFHTDPSGVGSIRYDGETLFDGDFYWEPNLPPDYGNVRTITANPADCYEFDHWETTGKIYLFDPYSQTTKLTVEGPGELHVHFRVKECTVTFYTDPSEGSSITFDGATYTNGQSDVFNCGTYTATANPAECYVFDHWESGENVVVTDPNANPTSVEVKCGGWLKAVFRLVRCEVTFYTDPTDPSFNITFNNKTYTNSQSDTFYCGTSGSATANTPEGWEFDYWKVTGNVYVEDSYVSPTTVTIKCGGTLTAVFKPIAECKVTFYTDPSDVGSISFEGKTYANGESGSFKNGTSGPATADAPECWMFDHWLTSGNVSVSDAYANPTTFTIHCGGNLTAVFKRIECVVTFYTDPSSGSITFNGTTYANNQSDIFDCGTSGPATANPPEGWGFICWEVGGNVYVSDTRANRTTVTIKCGGNLTAVFTKVSIVYVDPSETVGPPPNVGENFTWTIRVDAVSGLYLWRLDLSWDPTILELQGNPIEGNCLKSAGSTAFLWESITPGHIAGLTCTLLGDVPGVDVPPAPNDLANVTFKVLNYTCSLGTRITISDSHLLDQDGNKILHLTRPAKLTLCPTDLTVSSIIVQYDRAYFYANVTDGCHVYVNITNIGDADAGPFNVTFSVTWMKEMVEEYYKKTLVPSLAKGETIPLHYQFTIWHVGNYSVTVMVDSDFKIPESNEDNNTLTRIVKGRGAGDINGDDKVDYRDLFRLAKAYGSEISDPNWDPDADINCDGKIGYKDLFLLAKNYGKTFPDP